MVRVVISCMDRRLHEYLDRYHDNNTIFLRNAGANVSAMVDQIREIEEKMGIDEAIVMPHTDCAAMKLVKNSYDTGNVDKELGVLLDQFKDVKGGTVEEVETLNLQIQEEKLRNILGSSKAKSQLINMREAYKGDYKGELRALFSPPSPVSQRALASIMGQHDSVYIISTSPSTAHIDLKIVRSVGVQKVMAVETAGGSGLYPASELSRRLGIDFKVI